MTRLSTSTVRSAQMCRSEENGSTWGWREISRASNEGQTKVRKDFTITEKAPTRAFSWLKAPTRAFTFKTLLGHYAKC